MIRAGKHARGRTTGRWLARTALAGLIAIVAAGASSATVGPNVLIAGTNVIENEPSIAVSQGRMVAAWYQARYLSATGWSSSLDGGATWNYGGSVPHGQTLIEGMPTLCADDHGNFLLALIEENMQVLEMVNVYRGHFQNSAIVWDAPIRATPPIEYGY